jgi:hypothetical protein
LICVNETVGVIPASPCIIMFNSHKISSVTTIQYLCMPWCVLTIRSTFWSNFHVDSLLRLHLPNIYLNGSIYKFNSQYSKHTFLLTSVHVSSRKLIQLTKLFSLTDTLSSITAWVHYLSWFVCVNYFLNRRLPIIFRYSVQMAALNVKLCN